jgi:hemerythrin
MTTVGDPALYAEHAEFHGHVLRLLHALRVDALAALDALQAHAREHFAAEDVDLRKMGSGNANRHLDEHAAVLKSLAEVRAVLAGESPGDKKHTLLQRLAWQFLDWLPKHVQEWTWRWHDRFRVRTSGAPVRIQSSSRGQSCPPGTPVVP